MRYLNLTLHSSQFFQKSYSVCAAVFFESHITSVDVLLVSIVMSHTICHMTYIYFTPNANVLLVRQI